MKALILKDFLNLKQLFKSQILSILFILGIGLYMKSISYIMGILIMLSLNYALTCFSYDEKSNFYSYALGLPLSRKTIVLARYFVTYIILIGMTIFSSLLNIFIFTRFMEFTNMELQLTTMALISIALFSIATILPLVFKNGVEKTRIYLFVCIFIPIMLILFFKNRILAIDESDIIYFINYILPILMIIINFLSINLSIKIMDKKDF